MFWNLFPLEQSCCQPLLFRAHKTPKPNRRFCFGACFCLEETLERASRQMRSPIADAGGEGWIPSTAFLFWGLGLFVPVPFLQQGIRLNFVWEYISRSFGCPGLLKNTLQSKDFSSCPCCSLKEQQGGWIVENISIWNVFFFWKNIYLKIFSS